LLHLTRDRHFDDYCNASEDTNPHIVTKAELAHLGHIAWIEPSKWWLRKGRAPSFKKLDAAWLLLYAIASPYETENEDGISVKV